MITFSLILALMNLASFQTQMAHIDGFASEQTCQAMADELMADAQKRYGDKYSFVAVCVKQEE